VKSFLLAGTQSGCGKTSVTLALLQYIKQKQDSFACFKAGPDFLDPLWHQAITGQVSLNLDTRMMGEAECRRLFSQNQAEVALIEGVMGMFDGRSGVGEAGSSAHLAKTLNIPVVLVVDAKGMSGTIVALVSGFVEQAKKMGVMISGVIANRIGSEHHAGLLRDFLIEYQLPPLLAWMEKNAPVLPERHLGLVRPTEQELPDFLPALHVDDAVLQSVWGQVERSVEPLQDNKQRLIGKTIAIAEDDACCFCYQSNRDWLQQQGATTLSFSPVAGDSVPAEADALWLPGGYPELNTEALSTSDSWQSIRRFIEDDKPVLAECGGMMMLGQSLEDKAGKQWPMANILPFTTRMQDRLAALGYRQDASGLSGHEFHHSVRKDEETLPAAFELKRGDQGMRYKNLRASYVHWYFSSAPEVIASWFGSES
jgi:cobyrinic acid a,c-diamide synthase